MIFRKRHPAVGSRPGTLVIPDAAPAPKIHMINFCDSEVTELDVENIDQLQQAFADDSVTWIDVQGMGDEALIRRLSGVFKLHPLLMEDVVNVPQRPKSEPYGDQLLVVVRMVRTNEAGDIQVEQVSVVLGKNYVLTFQEHHGDVLDPVRRRIRDGQGPIRHHGADYLAYAIIDTIVDGYFPVLETIGDRLQELEDEVLFNPGPEKLRDLNRMKNQLVNLRRAIWPQREAVNSLVRDENPLVTKEATLYLRDTYDHCVQTSEVAEMYREMVTGLMSIYLSAVANRTNDVMKVLTIVATIFIPLTFVAGVYGMNFQHMPELPLWWTYPLVLLLMLAVGICMLIFFVRKGWLGTRRSSKEAEPDS